MSLDSFILQNNLPLNIPPDPLEYHKETHFVDKSLKQYVFDMSSDSCDYYINSSVSEYVSNLKETITIEDDEVAFMSIDNACVPISFYHCNHLSNKIKITEHDATHDNTFDILFDYGNWSIDELVYYLIDKLNTQTTLSIVYNVVYKKATNKLTISTTTLNKTITFDFMDPSSCYQLLGFYFQKYYLTSITPLTSDRCINVEPITQLNLRVVDYIFDRFDMYAGTKSNVLTQIPIDGSPNDIIYLNSPSPQLKIINKKYINSFHISLTDVYSSDRIIDLNGIHWQFSLIITVQKKEEK